MVAYGWLSVDPLLLSLHRDRIPLETNRKQQKICLSHFVFWFITYLSIFFLDNHAGHVNRIGTG